MGGRMVRMKAVCLIVDFFRIGDSFGSGVTGRAELFVLRSREFYLLGFLVSRLVISDAALGTDFRRTRVVYSLSRM